MKAHRPWQPHLDRDPLFNPFVPTTVRPFAEEPVEFTPDESDEAVEGEEQSTEQGSDQADVKNE